MNSSDSVRTTRFSNPRVAGSIPAAPTTPKKPSQSQQLKPHSRTKYSDESKLYLRAAIDHTLAKVEADSKPLTRKEWADYERLRQLVRMYRQTGRMNWSVLWWAFGTAALVALILVWRTPKDLLYCEIGCLPSTRVRVVEQYSDTDFMLQMVVAGVPQEPEVRRFCEKVPLEAGFTLTRLRVADKGDCWSTAPFKLAYVIQRYFGTVMPTLPDNCHQDPANPIYGRVSCSGRPNFEY